MKAVICNDFAPLDQLVYGDMPDPVAKGDQVVIRVEAAGVNYPDGLLVQGLYQMRPEHPFVPGMEAAGVVESVGPDVKRLKVGDRVAFHDQVGRMGSSGRSTGSHVHYEIEFQGELVDPEQFLKAGRNVFKVEDAKG